MSWAAGGSIFRQSFKEGEKNRKSVKLWEEINDLSNVRVEAAEPLDNGLHPELWKAKKFQDSLTTKTNNNQKSHNNAWDLETWT